MAVPLKNSMSNVAEFLAKQQSINNELYTDKSVQHAARKKVTTSQEMKENILRQVDIMTGVQEGIEVKPVLAEPKSNAEQNKLIFFTFNLLKVNGAMQLDKLLANLRNTELNSQAQYNLYSGMAEQISQASVMVENAEAAYQQAKELLKAAEQAEAAAQGTMDEAQTEFESLQPDDPAYAQAQKKLEQAKNALAEAQQNTRQVREKLEQAQKTSQEAKNYHASLIEQSLNQQYIDALAVNKHSTGLKPDKSSSGTMALIIAQCIQLMGDLSVKKLKADLESSNKLQESRQKEMQKKSEEYQEKLRRAEEANKITGCLADILGGLAVLVGAITSFFGGAGVGLMAVGIGLLAADGITEAATGKSLTSMMMDPIMKYVLNPLMDIIGKAVTAIFDYTPLGLLLQAIDKATGANIMDTVHAVVTATAAVAVMVALAMLAKSAAKFAMKGMNKLLVNLIGQSVKQALQQTLKKFLPQILKSAAKQLAKAFAQVKNFLTEKLAKDPATLQARLLQLEKLRLATTVSSTGAQATGNIIVGNLQKEMSEAIAGMTLNEAAIRISREQQEHFIAYFQREQEAFMAMTKLMSKVLMENQKTGRFVLRRHA